MDFRIAKKNIKTLCQAVVAIVTKKIRICHGLDDLSCRGVI